MYNSILVPLDGSDHAAKALEHAADLAKSANKLTLVSINHTVDQLFGTRQPDPASASEITDEELARDAYDEERSRIWRYLQDASMSLAGGPFEVATQMGEGDPAEQILKIAGDVGADLIVISAFGTSASTTPSQTGVFGKVADAILKGAKVPVLVVKPFA